MVIPCRLAFSLPAVYASFRLSLVQKRQRRLFPAFFWNGRREYDIKSHTGRYPAGFRMGGGEMKTLRRCLAAVPAIPEQAGADPEFLTAERMIHCWPICPIPEAKAALGQIWTAVTR